VHVNTHSSLSGDERKKTCLLKFHNKKYLKVMTSSVNNTVNLSLIINSTK